VGLLVGVQIRLAAEKLMSIVRIDAVAPNAREMRSIKRGWGLIHWVCFLPTYVPLLGIIVLGVTVNLFAGDYLPSFLISATLIGTGLLWLLTTKLARWACAHEARKAPVGGLDWCWTIDAQGFAFDNGLQSNRLDWRGVKAIREDRDRLVFLVSPSYNPVLPLRLLEPDQTEALRQLIAHARVSGRLGAGVDYPPPPADKA